MPMIKEYEILLVEDDPDDAELSLHALRSVLEPLSKKTLHLKDGVEALDFVLAQNQYEGQKVWSDLKLIIIDMKLPKIDGIEVLKALREDERTRNIPIVIMTSSKEKRDIKAAYENGANSYIVKPLSFDSYTKTVVSLVDYWVNLNESLR